MKMFKVGKVYEAWCFNRGMNCDYVGQLTIDRIGTKSVWYTTVYGDSGCSSLSVDSKGIQWFRCPHLDNGLFRAESVLRVIAEVCWKSPFLFLILLCILLYKQNNISYRGKNNDKQHLSQSKKDL